VVGNFSKRTVTYKLPDWADDGEVLLDNYGDYAKRKGSIRLNPYQAFVIEK